VDFFRPAVWPLDARWLLVSAEAAVDLFFIISGFLITQVLVQSLGRPNGLRGFYVRRAARIMPLALLAVAVSYVLFPSTRHLWPAYAFFVNNYVVMAAGLTMQGVGVMWSLAIEEQFYLLFPLLCVVIPRRHLWMVVGAVGLVSFAANLSHAERLIDGVYAADIRTHLHAYVIAIGCWLALLRLQLVPRPRLVTGALVALMFLPSMAQRLPLGKFEGPILLLLAGSVWVASGGRIPSRLPWLRFLGVRCYGLYLIHPFMGAATAQLLPYFGVLPRGARFGPLAFYILSTFILATLVYRYFELPFMRLVRGGEIRVPLAQRDGPPLAQRLSLALARMRGLRLKLSKSDAVA
jgi:peptidoglycan/LPS O-acetylase OafA/YrhL